MMRKQAVRSVQVFPNVGFPPFPVPEEGAKGARDLPMLIAFGAGRERTGISQNVAPVLEKLRLAIKRMIDWGGTRKRRHDATCFHHQSPVMLMLEESATRISALPINIAQFHKLIRKPGCFPVYSSSPI